MSQEASLRQEIFEIVDAMFEDQRQNLARILVDGLARDRAAVKAENATSDLTDLRDQFAMAALTGLVTRESGVEIEKRASIAYRYADAMLAARTPTGEKP